MQQWMPDPRVYVGPGCSSCHLLAGKFQRGILRARHPVRVLVSITLKTLLDWAAPSSSQCPDDVVSRGLGMPEWACMRKGFLFRCCSRGKLQLASLFRSPVMRPAPMEGAEAWLSSAETPAGASCVRRKWLESCLARSRLRSLRSMRDMGADLSCLQIYALSSMFSTRRSRRGLIVRMNAEEEMCLPPAYMGDEAMMMAGQHELVGSSFMQGLVLRRHGLRRPGYGVLWCPGRHLEIPMPLCHACTMH